MATWAERSDYVRIECSNSSDLLWAAVAGQISVGGFGAVSVPSGSSCFVVVMASCVRKSSQGQNHYYAHMGSLYLVADQKESETTEAVYRPTHDEFRTGKIAQTTLSGRFRVLPHPAGALESAAHGYNRQLAAFLRKQRIRHHGLITSTELIDFYGYAPLTHMPFNTILYKPADLRTDWATAVAVACWMLHCSQPLEEYPPKLWRCVGTLALTLLSGPYPMADNGENSVHIDGIGWTKSTDSRNHPAFGLIRNKDCDGKALAMCEYFYGVKDLFSNTSSKSSTDYGYKAAAALLSEFEEAYMASVMVDSAKVDGTKHSEPSGHCIVILTKAPGDFSNGTFVASCNMIHNFWPPTTQTLSELFALEELSFSSPTTDYGGYFFVKPSDLSLYQEAVYFVGRDGAYVTGHSCGKGRAWDPSTLGYTGALQTCSWKPTDFRSVLNGATNIVKLPSTDSSLSSLPAFKFPAELVKNLNRQARKRDNQQLKKRSTGASTTPNPKRTTVTLTAPYADAETILDVGLGQYGVQSIHTDFKTAEFPF